MTNTCYDCDRELTKENTKFHETYCPFLGDDADESAYPQGPVCDNCGTNRIDTAAGR